MARFVMQPNFTNRLFTQNSSVSNQVPNKDTEMSATKTAAPEVKTPEIKQEVRDMAAKLGIAIDPKTGTATQTATIESLLPEDLTVAQLKKVDQFRTVYVAAQTLAHGEAAIPVFKKHSELDASTLEVQDPTGNKFSTTILRSKLVGAPGGDKSEKFGVAAASIELKAARKTGSLGAVRAHLSSLATQQLASK